MFLTISGRERANVGVVEVRSEMVLAFYMLGSALALLVLMLRRSPGIIGLMWRWRWTVGVLFVFWFVTWWIVIPAVVVAAWPRLMKWAKFPPVLRRADPHVRRVRERFESALAIELLRFGLQRAKLPMIAVRSAERTPSGWDLRVRYRRGCSGWPDKFNQSLASTLRCRDVQCFADADNASRGTIRIITADPLRDLAGRPWPWLERESADLRRVPVGLDETGAEITVRVRDRHVLVGGQTGSGKSVAVSMLVAAVAMSDATLYCVDGKGGIELKTWRSRSRKFGVTADQAAGVLRAVRAEMDRRYEWLDAQDSTVRKMPADVPPCVLVIDELALFTTGKNGEFNETLRDLLARGRAAGVVVIAATQKPEAKVVPSSIRDLFAYRWGLSCPSPHMSDTILGSGQAADGYDASRIGRQPGVGYLFAEEDKPRRIRTYFLTDRQLDQIAKRVRSHDAQSPVGQNGAGQLAEPLRGVVLPAQLAQPEVPTGTTDPSVARSRVPSKRDVKRVMIEAELSRSPDASDREIARRVECSHHTVGAARKRLGL